MDAEDASEAVKLLNPKVVIPMHFGTFPVLAKNPSEFITKVNDKTPYVQVLALKPGQSNQI